MLENLSLSCCGCFEQNYLRQCVCVKRSLPNPFPAFPPSFPLSPSKCQQQEKQWNGKHLHALERKYAIKGNERRQ